MPPIAPAPEKEPITTRPTCPGCPTPQEAERVPGDCTGPQRVEWGEKSAEDAGVEEQTFTAEEIIMCPKTQKTIRR